ncbi:U3 small nucleolar RNA-associated protein 25 [Apiospora arundinis]
MTGSGTPPGSQPTPKRKRDDVVNEQRLASAASSTTSAYPYITKMIFSFEAPNLPPSEPEDGNSSPRTKVAHQFRDLALVESGGGVSASTQPSSSTMAGAVAGGSENGKSNDNGGGASPPAKHNDLQHTGQTRFSTASAVFDFDGARSTINGNTNCSTDQQMDLDDDGDANLRKRVKMPDVDTVAAFGTNSKASADSAGPIGIDASGRLSFQGVDPGVVKAKYGSSGQLKRSYPSINRLADSKSRSRRRAGTPPLSLLRRKAVETSIEEEPTVVDPVRAALTWHEDEITVYDAEDKDDDGTGLNGIGFKPTAAVAYARAQKRRQQLTEYRKREESEARARRNQRRREQLGEAAVLKRSGSMIRVHFSEAEPEAVVMT